MISKAQDNDCKLAFATNAPLPIARVPTVQSVSIHSSCSKQPIAPGRLERFERLELLDWLRAPFYVLFRCGIAAPSNAVDFV